MLHDPVDLMNFLLDFLLIAIGMTLAWNAIATHLKGKLGNAMRMIAVGAVILGAAHLTETVLDQHFHLQSEFNELVHRCFILVGMLSISIGMGRVSSAINRGTKAAKSESGG